MSIATPPLPTPPAPPVPYRTIGDLIKVADGVPIERVLFSPPPGTATEADLLAAHTAGGLYELVDGTLVEKAVGAYSSFLAAELIGILRVYVVAHDLGVLMAPDGMVRYAPRLVRLPDVSFISWKQLPDGQLPDDGIIDVIPELAVEVLSKSNTPAEMARKLRDYFAAGTRLAWVIDPASLSARVYTAADAGTQLPPDGVLDGDPVIPGFRLSLTELFGRMRPRGR